MLHRKLLPPRPLGLRLSFYLRWTLGGLALLGFTAFLGFASLWAIADAWHLRRDQAVWAAGTPAVDGRVKGHSTSKGGLTWLLAIYDLEVDYTDATWHRHTGSVGFATLFGAPDTGDHVEVRYDPAHPDRFAVSWAVEAAGARWRAIVIGGLFFGALALLMGWGTLKIAREPGAIRRCAQVGEETPVALSDIAVVRNQKGEPTSKRRYTLVGPPGADGKPLTWSEEINLEKAEPLRADREGTKAWALLHDGQHILLRSDLYPLALSAAERAEVVQRVEALTA